MNIEEDKEYPFDIEDTPQNIKCVSKGTEAREITLE
jgi:hypothetical protein